MTEFDADIVIAGGGHNGLVAGAYLAKSGLEVIVLEGRSVLGGGATTEELTLPGFLHDPYSTGHFGMLANPIFASDEIPLAKYGLSYIAPDPVVAMPTRTGSISIWRDENRTAAEFAKYSEADAAAWRVLCNDWDRLAPIVRNTIGRPPGPPGKSATGWLARLRAFLGLSGQVLAQMSPVQAARMQAVASSSALDVIESRFESPEVRMVMAWLVAITCQPVDAPGTGPLAIALPTPLARGGWVNAVGGAVSLPNALAGYVADCGGQIFTEARVERFVVDNGRVVGAATEDGRVFRGRKGVISSLHFTQLPALVPDFALPKDYLEGIDRWEAGPGLFVVHLAVERNLFVRSGQTFVPSVLTGSISPSGLRRQLADLKAKKASFHEDIWLLAACSTIVDPTRAPDGKGVVKMMTMAPYSLDDDPANWEDRKEEYADFLVELYSRTVVGFKPGSELARAIATPVDIARANPNFFGGSPQGGHAMPSQAGLNRPVAGWAAYRTPVPGLFQTGLSTHPGGAVNGWAGRNAARVVLADIGMDADKFVPPV